jgi:hypothetical protein
MWYGVWDEYNYDHNLPFSYNACYSESHDGLQWSRPFLGVFDYRGSTRNNCILLGNYRTQNIDVEIDPRIDARRFLAIHNDKEGIMLSTSTDGKSFDFARDEPLVSYHSDTHNNMVYDEVRDRWLMYLRPQRDRYAAAGLEGVGRRRVAVKESRDLVHWTPERVIVIPEENDPDNFYGMTVFRRGDLFFGVLQPYETDTHRIYAELAWSTDGWRWNRLPVRDDARFLCCGPEGSWDDGMVFLADRPIEQNGELWFYYGGWDGPHDVRDRDCAAGLATTGHDRLIAAVGRRGDNARLLSRPFPVRGDLFVNAESSGAIRVSVHRSDGEPLDGWSEQDCTPFTGDELDARVAWGTKSLADLAGKTVRLRFYLDDAKLYAFDIRD